MTEEELSQRRDLIAESAGAEAPPWQYWLTRNRVDGQLSSRVDVWLSRPSRSVTDDGDVYWFVHGEGAEREHFTRWTIARATREVGGGIPDTDRECTVVDGPRRSL